MYDEQCPFNVMFERRRRTSQRRMPNKEDYSIKGKLTFMYDQNEDKHIHTLTPTHVYYPAILNQSTDRPTSQPTNFVHLDEIF